MNEHNNVLYNEKKILLNRGDDFVNDSRQFEIAKLGQLAISTTDLELFMEEVVNLVHRSLGTEFVKILKLTDDQTKLKLIKGVGWKGGVVGNAYVMVDYTSQAGYTLINKQSVIVRNFKDETRFLAPQILVDHNIVSGISITIPGEEKPFGILGAHSTHEMNFTTDDVSFLHSVSYILSSFITHQEAYNKLREEEAKYRILMEYASDAIFIFDKAGTILDVNSKACEMTLYDKTDLLQKNITGLYRKKDLEKFPLKIEAVNTGKEIFIERKLVRKDGSTVYVEVGSTLLPNNTIQGIYRDITSRKENEKLMRNIQKMEALGRFSGGLAHDFNNYLTVISGYSDKLIQMAEEINFNDLVSDLERIKKTSEKASVLTKELLGFSRKEFDNAKVISVNLFIQDLQETILSFLGESITFKLQLHPTNLLVNINPDRLQQSLLNLIINAKDAINTTGKITISTSTYHLDKDYENYAFDAKPGDYVTLSVKDTGKGMSDAVKDHLFEPFYTTKKDRGTGLGLTTIYKFIQQFNGYIIVDSLEGKGTTITLFLKQYTGIIPSSETESICSKTKELASAKQSDEKQIKTLLLVEDNTDLRDLLEKILTKHDFTVLKASNGVEALELLRNSPLKIDFLLTDTVMPKMDGLELVNRLRKDGFDLKIILVSGYAPPESIMVDDITFLQKPFAIDDMIKVLNNLS